ncbi:MAG: hypothetical protein JWN36_951 [Microbacteriaceae bacterium]|jgi:hypothetical protein|nr:hypothetical protein [Microbacteriaceae bacterium]
MGIIEGGNSDEGCTHMDDLTGNADERIRALAELAAVEALEIEWLRRQLDLALAAWAADATALDIDQESRADY